VQTLEHLPRGQTATSVLGCTHVGLQPACELMFMSIYKELCVYICLSVCPIKTRERVGRLSPNFHGSSRAPRERFKAQKI